MANLRLLLGAAAIVGLLGYSVFNADDTLLKYVLPRTEPPAAAATPVAAEQASAPAAPQQAALNPLQLSAGALSETIRRPLFNPTRAPRIEAPPPPPPPEPVVTETPVEPAPAFDPGDYTLLGVVASTELKTAMIRSNKTDEIFHVSPGQKLLELTIEAVDAREVTLRLGEDSYKLKLFENPGQRTKAPPEMQFQQQMQMPVTEGGVEQ